MAVFISQAIRQNPAASAKIDDRHVGYAKAARFRLLVRDAYGSGVNGACK